MAHRESGVLAPGDDERAERAVGDVLVTGRHEVTPGVHLDAVVASGKAVAVLDGDRGDVVARECDLIHRIHLLERPLTVGFE